MTSVSDSVGKLLEGMGCCFRSRKDPEGCCGVSGAVLYPEDLKPGKEGGPRYVIAVGATPCERSTVDICHHYDSDLPYHFSTAPSPILTIMPPLMNICTPVGNDKWFPSISCTPKRYNRKYREFEYRQLIHRRGYGQMWYLLGKRLPPVEILRCFTTSLIESREDVGLMRLSRAGEYVTIAPCDCGAPFEVPEDSPFPIVNKNWYNVLLLKYKNGMYPGGIDRTVTILNKRLLEDPRFILIRNIIRERFDADFGKYDEYVTAVFQVSPATYSCYCDGMAMVYTGPPNEDVECALVECLYCNHAVSPHHYLAQYDVSCASRLDSGREAFISATTQASKMSMMRKSGPPTIPEWNLEQSNNKSRNTMEENYDPYGWVSMSHGPGLGLSSPAQYSITVNPNLALRLGIDINPVFQITRETMYRWCHPCCETDFSAMKYRPIRVSNRHVLPLGNYCTLDENPAISNSCTKSGASDFETETAEYKSAFYKPEDGCDCDDDELFIARISAGFRNDIRWLKNAIRAMKLKGSDCSINTGGEGHDLDDSEIYNLEQLIIVTYPSNKYGEVLDNTIYENEKTEVSSNETPPGFSPIHPGAVLWYMSSNGRWITRGRTESYGSSDNRCQRSNASYEMTEYVHENAIYRSLYKGIDLYTERRVARSSMTPITSRICCRMVAADGGMYELLRDRKENNTSSSDVLVFEPLDNGREKRFIRRTDESPVEAGTVECCFIACVGNTMRPVMRRFFSIDSRNIIVLRDDIAVTVKSVCSLSPAPQSTFPALSNRGFKTSFIFALASVDYDLCTGARNCKRLEVAFGGSTTRTDAIFSACQKIDGLCQEACRAGVFNLRTMEAVPQLGCKPFRFILEFSDDVSDCALPTVVSCSHFCALPLHCEEARVLGSDSAWRVPTQEMYCKTLHRSTVMGIDPPTGNCCLGLFFPIKGVRMLTMENKRCLGEYCQRFKKWFQWGNGCVHYSALRQLVPLCANYLSDVCVTSNFFGYGMLFHLHCRPNPEREKMVVMVISKAIKDAQKFSDSSLYVDVKSCF